ncbi:alpha/beta hydrolase family protein [Lactobacillus delbrueckii]|uniref:alpha/beta hydrolase family protein n=1 Tax=Lactobacillus delbrueckii TaxID=1584 RepID=UPI001E5EB5A2|nr:prolyl oligopeptidase family serine peptidase [Lactobacillus delbrueckii]MCD5524441.1 prolyl oligopeptidase family serine peptidase [Lactobacillus delbrueckii subsp. lactis]
MRKIVEYIFCRDSEKVYFYLHGGPFFSLGSWQEDPFATMLYNEQRNLILVNHPIVYGNGGISDYQFLKEYFGKYKREHPNTEMILLGESYGGYLASLFAAEYIFRKIITISAFTSIDYQELFSSERSWLKNYLSENALDFYTLCRDNKVNTQTIFINGSRDSRVPYQQFLALPFMKKFKVNILPGFTHRECGTRLEYVISLVKQEL